MTQPKPASLKVIDGSRQNPARLAQQITPIEIPLVNEVPAHPFWLPNEHAIAEWNRLAPIFTANGLLTEGSISALGNLCALHGKFVEMWQAGYIPSATMLSQYRALINDFGLTPIAQQKIKSIKEPPKTNAFSKNGQNSKQA